MQLLHCPLMWGNGTWCDAMWCSEILGPSQVPILLFFRSFVLPLPVCASAVPLSPMCWGQHCSVQEPLHESVADRRGQALSIRVNLNRYIAYWCCCLRFCAKCQNTAYHPSSAEHLEHRGPLQFSACTTRWTRRQLLVFIRAAMARITLQTVHYSAQSAFRSLRAFAIFHHFVLCSAAPAIGFSVCSCVTSSQK